MQWAGPSLVNLGDALADLYPTREDSYRVVEGAGLEKLPGGLDAPIDRYRLDPDRFFITSEADDWTAVAVLGRAEEK